MNTIKTFITVFFQDVSISEPDEDNISNYEYGSEADDEIESNSDDNSTNESLSESVDQLFDEILNDENFEYESSFKKLHKIIADNENIEAEVFIKKFELLLAGLKYSRKYSLNQTAMADLFKMLNCVIESKSLPDSRHKLDQVFNTKDIIEFHAICPKCNRYS